MFPLLVVLFIKKVYDRNNAFKSILDLLHWQFLANLGILKYVWDIYLRPENQNDHPVSF